MLSLKGCSALLYCQVWKSLKIKVYWLRSERAKGLKLNHRYTYNKVKNAKFPCTFWANQCSTLSALGTNLAIWGMLWGRKETGWGNHLAWASRSQGTPRKWGVWFGGWISLPCSASSMTFRERQAFPFSCWHIWEEESCFSQLSSFYSDFFGLGRLLVSTTGFWASERVCN